MDYFPHIIYRMHPESVNKKFKRAFQIIKKSCEFNAVELLSQFLLEIFENCGCGLSIGKQWQLALNWICCTILGAENGQMISNN